MRTLIALILIGHVMASQAETRRIVDQLLLMQEEQARQIDMDAYKQARIRGEANSWSRPPDWRVPGQIQLNATPHVDLREALLPADQVPPLRQGSPIQFKQPEDPNLKLILPRPDEEGRPLNPPDELLLPPRRRKKD